MTKVVVTHPLFRSLSINTSLNEGVPAFPSFAALDFFESRFEAAQLGPPISRFNCAG
jgi:hypothetical protein